MRKPPANVYTTIAISLIAVALIVIARSQSQSSRSILTRPAPPFDHRIPYGKDPLQFGELRLPKGPGPHPVAVIVHGGCWLSEYGLAYMGHLSAALTEIGIATWNIEYRRIGNDGGGWPGTFEDVARATDYLRTLAKNYPLDLDSVVAIGHSAGGHLVLLLGARKTEEALKLKGVIPLAAITDLRRKGTACDTEAGKLMGNGEYDRASPVELVPLGVKQILIHGEADNIVPVAMVNDYVERAKGKGDDIKLVVIEKAGHFELVDPKSIAWEKVRDAVLGLLKK